MNALRCYLQETDSPRLHRNGRDPGRKDCPGADSFPWPKLTGLRFRVNSVRKDANQVAAEFQERWL
jgi:hypothetical protein